MHPLAPPFLNRGYILCHRIDLRNQVLESIELPANLTYIGQGAFGYCSNLRTITIPDSVTEIGEEAFTYCDQLTITVSRDSYAAQYCKENNLNYTYPDANNWLNQ